ncbi:hypothetical protein FIBSPDRAFT_381134 [Athelia psychrophila]|uniref:Uncharacterized protein n=1 Tax=Athelia psychrophila TaxID=1759441 RepID=A0A167VCE5_9AGAM|nr:hypothetical protein FIBSPDRAFT_381134 [Fibularhizoctonia sp. CBS 109695]
MIARAPPVPTGVVSQKIAFPCRQALSMRTNFTFLAWGQRQQTRPIFSTGHQTHLAEGIGSMGISILVFFTSSPDGVFASFSMVDVDQEPFLVVSPWSYHIHFGC